MTGVSEIRLFAQTQVLGLEIAKPSFQVQDYVVNESQLLTKLQSRNKLISYHVKPGFSGLTDAWVTPVFRFGNPIDDLVYS